MYKKEGLKKNPVRPLSPHAVSDTFSIIRILKELVFDKIEYRLKGPCVSSSRGLCAVEKTSQRNFGKPLS
jgi:hypothetical protein